MKVRLLDFVHVLRTRNRFFLVLVASAVLFYAQITATCYAVSIPNTSAESKLESGRNLLAPKNVAGQLDEAFHYTARQWGDVIKREGLRPGSYGTPNGNLSGLGAKLELSLPPTRSAPDIRIRIDLDGLRKAGYEIPTPKRVSNVVTGPDGRVYTMPGGGYEMQFPFEIPGEFLEILPLR